MSKNCKIFVGNLSRKTRVRDLEDTFEKFGHIRDVEMKFDYAFIEFEDPRDAEDAVYDMDGRTVDGHRVSVQHAYGRQRNKGPAPQDVCFNCGKRGHWANECREGDWSEKCYRCGEGGHIRRDCKASRSVSKSPRSSRRSKSRSRSKDRSRRKDRPYARPKRHRSSSRSSGSPSTSRSPSKDRREKKDEKNGASKSGSRSKSPSERKSRTSSADRRRTPSGSVERKSPTDN